MTHEQQTGSQGLPRPPPRVLRNTPISEFRSTGTLLCQRCVAGPYHFTQRYMSLNNSETDSLRKAVGFFQPWRPRRALQEAISLLSFPFPSSLLFCEPRRGLGPSKENANSHLSSPSHAFSFRCAGRARKASGQGCCLGGFSSHLQTKGSTQDPLRSFQHGIPARVMDEYTTRPYQP